MVESSTPPSESKQYDDLKFCQLSALLGSTFFGCQRDFRFSQLPPPRLVNHLPVKKPPCLHQFLPTVKAKGSRGVQYSLLYLE
ncbi:vacuolar protein sorting-associated protein 70, partial [Moniliophthora roreri]